MRANQQLDRLRGRAALLQRLRGFFEHHGFLEIDTPLVADEVIPELHIEPFQLVEPGRLPLFLQASPELHMKRLLADGAAAIYQVTHSFRAGELGPLHRPEFTMVEWYRVGDDMSAGIALLDELMQHLLGTPPAQRISYADAFERHTRLAPFTATLDDFARLAPDFAHDDRDEWLNLVLARHVEPQLGRERPEIIYHYPASQASLARTTQVGGHDVAERFELYYRGVELANGYHELADAAEQRRRFESVNAARVADGRHALPLPERLLAALERGLPDCTGVALGFDRLAMLAAGATTIGDVLAFPTQ